MADTIDLMNAEETHTRAELRQKIGVLLGRRQRGKSPLHITTLNSAYAYLTGEFYIEPRYIDTEFSPGPDRIRWAVVIQAINQGCDLESYIPDPGDGRQGDDPTRPLRRAELEKLALHLKGSEDQRGWL